MVSSGSFLSIKSWIVFCSGEICFGKTVVVMIPEEDAEGSVVIDVKQNAAAEAGTDVFQA